ncbi:MAG: hypothetical protein ACRD3H_19255 [Terriglobales bacterium]|nr:hypothetical protein [Terriglobales bacterium]
MPPSDPSSAIPFSGANPFQPGAMVLATLGNPREKFWGVVLGLTPQGLSLSGIELASFADLVSMIKAGDSVAASVVFFPMHRIERVELDQSDDNVPSLSQRFAIQTGLDPVAVFGGRAAHLGLPGEQR